MNKVKKLISKAEFSKKITVAVLAFIGLFFIVSIGLEVKFGVSLSVYTGQLIAPALTVLGFYSLKSGYENGIKIKNSVEKVNSVIENIAEDMNNKNG